VAKKLSNKNLNKAKDTKEDEFYTQIHDIEKELGHYKDHFKDKVFPKIALLWVVTIKKNNFIFKVVFIVS
jgi:hypothetical protein